MGRRCEVAVSFEGGGQRAEVLVGVFILKGGVEDGGRGFDKALNVGGGG